MTDEPVVTPDVEATIGRETAPELAADEVCPSEIRRYVLATLDDNPLWYDTDFALKTKFGSKHGPGAYVLLAVRGSRSPLGVPDPVRRMGQNDGRPDGLTEERESAIPWPEGVVSFHGGDEVEYIQLPKEGDIISKVSKIVKVVERTGRSGRFGLLYVDQTYTNQHGEVLAINHTYSVARRVKDA